MRAAILTLLFAFGSTFAHADDRGDARVHYQAGVKAYNGADYRAAIKEFSAAQQLAPADLNNYNLALCFDKLGEADSAINYYKQYLDKVPGTDKRGEIEASVQRLDAAVKSSAAKKAAEEKAAADARAAEEAKKAEAMKKAEDEAHAAEEARKAEEARRADEDAKRNAPVGPPILGSSGRPADGVATPTRDPQLERARQIDINAIRDQRVGAGGSGIPQQPVTGPSMGMRDQQPRNDNKLEPTQSPVAQNKNAIQQPADVPPPAKADPIYKKWWFWVIVGVGAYVVYEIATSDPSNDRTAREAPLHGVSQAPRPTGLTLFSW